MALKELLKSPFANESQSESFLNLFLFKKLVLHNTFLANNLTFDKMVYQKNKFLTNLFCRTNVFTLRNFFLVFNR